MKTDVETLIKLKLLFSQYVEALESSQIKPLSLKIYKTNSENFVRWVEGQFEPGQKLERTKNVA